MMENQPRYDMYAFIHKALRKAMGECLVALGNVDTLDNDEFDRVVDQAQMLLQICLGHVEHENDFIHTAMEARRPGSSHNIANQHDDHEQHIAHLSAELQRIRQMPALRRAEPLHACYREFALWVADNFVHMEQEERDHNAVLWACYSDDEIRAIEQALVAHHNASGSPSIAVIQTQLMAALSPTQRADLLCAARTQMPATLFDALVTNLATVLSTDHHAKLLKSLAQQDAQLIAAG